MNQVGAKKIFIVAGELSGDRTGAWYVHKRKQVEPQDVWIGVGGNFLRSAGVEIFESYNQLNVVGVMEILAHLPRILRILRSITDYVTENNIDEVVLVDFPGFNLRLAQKLKKICPTLKITYVSPPQLWCWGDWRVKKIKAWCDSVVVMYPFEVAWYEQHGVKAVWIGSPVYDALSPHLVEGEVKKPCIALIPGSRYSEIERFLPLLAPVAQQLHKKYPQITFVMPLAQSLTEEFMHEQLQKVGLLDTSLSLTLVRDEDEKYRVLRTCCLAVTKPGTVTLELALLGVPSVVYFKISWPTFWLARMLIHVRHMSLPNLLLNQVVYPECIQQRCTVDEIVQQADQRFLRSMFGDKQLYREQIKKLADLREMLKGD